ncbi:MAG: hypothetical protein P4L99_25680 [Chthoniobacter sp.]|nr:hypothetical protein [Chthoniobacter sp.]
MPTLDSSHRVLLENLETFLAAQECLSDMEAFIWQAVSDLENELPEIGELPATWKAKESERWFQFDAFPNWSDTKLHLITIGIEGLTTVNLLRPDLGERCKAYIYSHVLATRDQIARFPDLTGKLRALTPPLGYVAGSQGGYVFTKTLGPVSNETLLSRTDLKRFLFEPMQELIDWLVGQSSQFEAFGKPAEAQA